MADSALRNLRFCTDTLAYLQSAAEEFVHLGCQPILELSLLVTVLYLPLNSPFTNQSRFQSCRYTKQMAGYVVGHITVAIVQFYTVAGLEQHGTPLYVQSLEISLAGFQRRILLINRFVCYHVLWLLLFCLLS